MTIMLDSYSQQKKQSQGMQAAVAYPFGSAMNGEDSPTTTHCSQTLDSQADAVQHCPRTINLLSKAGATWTVARGHCRRLRHPGMPSGL